AGASAGHDDEDPLRVEAEVVELAPPEREPRAAQDAADDHRPFGTAAVEHPPADLRGRSEPREEDEEIEARLVRVVAERDLRVDAREEEHGDEGDHREEQHAVVDEERAAAE